MRGNQKINILTTEEVDHDGLRDVMVPQLGQLRANILYREPELVELVPLPGRCPRAKEAGRHIRLVPS